MDGSIFRGFEVIYKLFVVLLVVFVPLGLWKMVDIIIWLFKHLSVSFQ